MLLVWCAGQQHGVYIYIYIYIYIYTHYIYIYLLTYATYVPQSCVSQGRTGHLCDGEGHQIQHSAGVPDPRQNDVMQQQN